MAGKLVAGEAGLSSVKEGKIKCPVSSCLGNRMTFYANPNFDIGPKIAATSHKHVCPFMSSVTCCVVARKA